MRYPLLRARRPWPALLIALVVALAVPVANARAMVPITEEPISGDSPAVVYDQASGVPSEPAYTAEDQVLYAGDPAPPEPEPVATDSTPVEEVVSDAISGSYEQAVPEDSAAYAETAAAIGPLPSCRSLTIRGNVGYIAVQTSPVGYVQWGAYMYRWWENYGWWAVNVFVNGRRVDAKSQYYPPHGSLPPSVAPPGSIFSLYVVHVFFRWHWWGFAPAVAYGNATCIVP